MRSATSRAAASAASAVAVARLECCCPSCTQMASWRSFIFSSRSVAAACWASVSDCIRPSDATRISESRCASSFSPRATWAPRLYSACWLRVSVASISRSAVSTACAVYAACCASSHSASPSSTISILCWTRRRPSSSRASRIASASSLRARFAAASSAFFSASAAALSAHRCFCARSRA